MFDQLGREVAILVNEAKDPGEYTARFDGSTLTSGVYFCRFTSGRFVETKKAILIK